MPSRSPSVTPKLMTFGITIAGLLPMMWSTKAGAEVMKPLAIPVLGGTVSSLIHILIVTPVIFARMREREIRGELLHLGVGVEAATMRRDLEPEVFLE